jgi:hypothetical protein
MRAEGIRRGLTSGLHRRTHNRRAPVTADVSQLMKQRHILLNISTVSVLVMATATPVYAHGGETFALYFGGIFLIGV